MKSIAGVLALQNGGWIVDDRIAKTLVYRRTLGAVTIRIPYFLSSGGYVLRRIAEIGPDKLVMGETAMLVISEIGEHLKNAGISAQIEDKLPLSLFRNLHDTKAV